MMVLAVFLSAAGLGSAPASADSAASESRTRTTNADFPTQLRPEPDSFKSLAKIPPATEIAIEDMRVIQLGKFKENWYLVTYEGITGWVRGDDLDGETAEKKYSVTYQAPELPGVSTPGGVSF